MTEPQEQSQTSTDNESTYQAEAEDQSQGQARKDTRTKSIIRRSLDSGSTSGAAARSTRTPLNFDEMITNFHLPDVTTSNAVRPTKFRPLRGPLPPGARPPAISLQPSTSQSSDKSQGQYLTPLDAHPNPLLHNLRTMPFQPYDPNVRESLSSSFYTEPSSYYSAEDGEASEGFADDEVPLAAALSSPHSRDNVLAQVEAKEAETWDDGEVGGKSDGAGQSQGKTQTRTQVTSSPSSPTPTTNTGTTTTPMKGANLPSRTSTRTTASNSTRLAGRSGSLSTSVGHASLGAHAGVSRTGSVTPSMIEPSRQSTSDSGVYPVGAGGKTQGAGGKTQSASEEGEQLPSLEEMVVGLEELIEEPEDEEKEGVRTGVKMKMPEPQHFDEIHLGMPGVDAGEWAQDTIRPRTQRPIRMPQAVPMPSPRVPPPYAFSDADLIPNSENPRHLGRLGALSSSRTHDEQGQGQGPLGGQPRQRKVSPLIGKMIPPAPKSPPPVPSEPTLGSVSIKMPSAGLTLGSGSAEKAGDGIAPLKVQKQAKKASGGASGSGGAGRTVGTALQESKQTEGEGEGPKEEQDYGTLVITSTASSRVERLTSGSGSFGRRTTLSSTSYMRHPETQSTTIKPENGYPSLGVGRSRQPDAHPRTMSTPRTRKPSASAADSEDAHHEGAEASSAVEHHPTRPPLIPGSYSQMDTQYVNMLLALDDIPTAHNIAAAFFNWILLAGFILFPGTFERLRTVDGGPLNGFLKSVTHLPLFVVAWVCVGIGVSGMIWLWWRWRKNYVWTLNKIWTPGLLNSLAGLLSTLASIYGTQGGRLGTTSLSTLIVTGAMTGVFGLLTGIYLLWFVRRVKAKHDREVGMKRRGKHGEGVVDMSTRQAS